jgi:choline dehydrogenase-like flavoprotein
MAYDYIVVGTGPGGAPVARDLARAGKRVLMVERGPRHEKGLGFPFGPRILHGMGLFCRSKEGVYVARGITVGGSSLVYNANVFSPPDRLYRRMGLDFRREVDEIKSEIGVKVLPERFFAHARGGNRLREAADKMGLHFESQEKFIDPDKCVPGCDWCMLGCPNGAKWTTRVYVDEAVKSGATLLVSSPVEKVVIEHDRAVGVTLKNGKTIRGDRVIVSAGGVGTPALLLRSGIRGVGGKFYMDPMNIVVGHASTDGGGAWKEMTFTHAIESFAETEGFIIGNLSAEGVAMTALMRANILRHNLPRLPRIKRGIGLFVKLADDHMGSISADESISKPFTENDARRMKRATDLAREIMIKAKVKEGEIAVARAIGGHPGGTAAMGEAVNTDFSSTQAENLYVCDGSVIPSSPGVPPSLTIMALSRLLGKMLLGHM